jgi:hypothetical protein
MGVDPQLTSEIIQEKGPLQETAEEEMKGRTSKM